MDDIVGDKDKFTVTYKGLANDVNIGDSIMLDDGLIELTVLNEFNSDFSNQNHNIVCIFGGFILESTKNALSWQICLYQTLLRHTHPEGLNLEAILQTE